MKAQSLHKIASILGLIITVVSAIELDHGTLVFGSQAEFEAFKRVENYKELMLALGFAVFLIWPAHVLISAIRAERDMASALTFWRRAALAQAVVLVVVTVALGWTVAHRFEIWN